MTIITQTLISAIITTLTFVGVYNYLPLGLFEEGEKLGAITTIQGSDTLKDSRTTINNNFTDLDITKMEMATTSVDAITTLSNLVSIGTLTTGTWNATVIDTAYGGTASTTWPSENTILYASTTNAMLGVPIGTVDQVLTLSNVGGSAGLVPVWASVAVNEASEYNWTGDHDFAGTSTLSTGTEAALSLFGPLFFSGISTTTLDFSGTAGNTSSSTVLSTDSNGNASWVPRGGILFAGATSTAATTASTTALSVTIPANTLTGNSAVLRGEASILLQTMNDADDDIWVSMVFGGEAEANGVASAFFDDLTNQNCATATTCHGTLVFYLNWDGTNQTGGFTMAMGDSDGTYNTEGNLNAGGKPESRTISVTTDQTFSIVLKRAGATGTFTLDNGYIELIQTY